MILDERLEFADGTALNTGGAGNYLIGDVIDLEVARDIGQGHPVQFYATVDTAATSGGSATLTIQLITSDAENMGSPDVIAQWGPFPVAEVTAGRMLVMAAVPAEGQPYKRYLGIRQVTGTAAFTAGAISAGLTLDQSGSKAYPQGAN